MSKLNKHLVDELIKDCKTPEDFFGENDLIKSFVKSIMESALNAELTTHLGYEKHDTLGHNTGNSRLRHEVALKSCSPTQDVREPLVLTGEPRALNKVASLTTPEAYMRGMRNANGAFPC